MENQEQQFCERLSKLIIKFYPEFKCPNKTSSGLLREIKTKIEEYNYKCDESEDEIITPLKKKYPPKMWTCSACNMTTTTRNRLNHERTDKHKNRLKELVDYSDT